MLAINPVNKDIAALVILGMIVNNAQNDMAILNDLRMQDLRLLREVGDLNS
jgi:hypothetical protein